MTAETLPQGRFGFLRAGARPAAKEMSRMIDEH
jgi:hypothetical protein